jgi:cardiolipin synthase (CMP-forming)
MVSRTLTLANQITILRLVFVPLFAILVVQRRYGVALVVLGAAAVSDGVDGLVARVYHQQSPLGVALDPIADKILMTTAYATLAFRDALPWWITIVVISRDVAIVVTTLVISLVSGYRPFTPTLLGKISTCVQLSTVLVALGAAAGISVVSHRLVQALVYATAVLTAASGIHYLVALRHYARTPSSGSGIAGV